VDVRIEDPMHPLNRLDFEPVADLIVGKTLLDVGCGKGTWLAYLKLNRPDIKAVGVDIEKAYVERCRKKGLEAYVMSIYSLKYPDSSWDTVTCMHVLEHLQDDRKALFELLRVARERVIIVLPRFYPTIKQWRQAWLEHCNIVYTPLLLDRLLRGLAYSYREHYNPTGVSESWLIVIDKDLNPEYEIIIGGGDWLQNRSRC